MKLEHYSEEKLKKQILKIAEKYLDLSKYKIFFFGSRVSKKGDEHSDIDIGIEGKDPVSVVTMEAIKEEIGQIRTLYKIEFVDFKKVSSQFYEVATQHIEIINKDYLK